MCLANVNSKISVFTLLSASALVYSFIHFPVGFQLEHRSPFRVSVITHALRHTVGLLWKSDQPVADLYISM
jgi:hypothetical protein